MTGETKYSTVIAVITLTDGKNYVVTDYLSNISINPGILRNLNPSVKINRNQR